MLEEHAVRVEGGWQCGLCPSFFHKAKHHTINHIESKHFPNSFVHTCAVCFKTVNTRKALEHHKRKCAQNLM